MIFQFSRLIPHRVENVDFYISFSFVYISALIRPILILNILLERADLGKSIMVKFILVGLVFVEIFIFKVRTKHLNSFARHCTYTLFCACAQSESGQTNHVNIHCIHCKHDISPHLPCLGCR